MVKGIMIWWSIVVKPQPREAPCSSPSARPGTASTEVPPSLCFRVPFRFKCFYRSLFILLFFSLMHFHSCFKFTITETATLLTWSSLRFRHSLSVSSLERKVNMLQQKCGVWNTKALHWGFQLSFSFQPVPVSYYTFFNLQESYDNFSAAIPLFQAVAPPACSADYWLSTCPPTSPSSVLLRPVHRTKPHPTLETGFTALG